MKKLIYADNAATTKLNIDAFEAMKPFLLDNFGNASQPYSLARIPKKALKEARETIARCINAEPDEIYFTSGGTESDNWAILGHDFACTKQPVVVTSQVEHHAVLNPCKRLEEAGFTIAYLPVSNEGIVSVEDLKKVLSIDTRLVSIMYVNNEIGTVQPIKALCKVAHENNVLFHTDAVQAVGHIKIDVKDLQIDLLSASAHKFNGPKGIGFLYVKKGTKIKPLMLGGMQEFGCRAGTENIAAIVGMAVALKQHCDMIEADQEHIKSLENAFFNTLSTSSLEYVRNGHAHIPGNISISFKNADGEMLLHRLDLMGIQVSTGAACDSVNTQVSHVLKAIKLEEEYAKGTIRISFSTENTVDEAIQIANALIKIIHNS